MLISSAEYIELLEKKLKQAEFAKQLLQMAECDTLSINHKIRDLEIELHKNKDPLDYFGLKNLLKNE